MLPCFPFLEIDNRERGSQHINLKAGEDLLFPECNPKEYLTKVRPQSHHVNEWCCVQHSFSYHRRKMEDTNHILFKCMLFTG